MSFGLMVMSMTFLRQRHPMRWSVSVDKDSFSLIQVV
jgi:hypothetical protein